MTAEHFDIACLQAARAAETAMLLSYLPADIAAGTAPDAVLLRIVLADPELGAGWQIADGDGPPTDDPRWDAVWAERLEACRRALDLLRAHGLFAAHLAAGQGNRMAVELTSYSYALHTAQRARAEASIYRDLAASRAQKIAHQAGALAALRAELKVYQDMLGDDSDETQVS
ncbi:hypothetical protein [Vineibacter terrae]|uniref:hypothetical protein n=1 Tax=Vineibacter terrae TaxID=2586908 RepID=UPI002E35CCC0|nr:hypothetical protein [Vineibacter terrae]HEX2886803.1 hypothetical protein [Vineibacter terrae]